MKITIIGAGAWGTALGRRPLQGKNEVTLWGHMAEWLEEIRQIGRNERFLPGIELAARFEAGERPAPRPGRSRVRRGSRAVPAFSRSDASPGGLLGE